LDKKPKTNEEKTAKTGQPEIPNKTTTKTPIVTKPQQQQPQVNSTKPQEKKSPLKPGPKKSGIKSK
jgi:hypothetical protein